MAERGKTVIVAALDGTFQKKVMKAKDFFPTLAFIKKTKEAEVILIVVTISFC